jgi:hypothetical protein
LVAGPGLSFTSRSVSDRRKGIPPPWAAARSDAFYAVSALGGTTHVGLYCPPSGRHASENWHFVTRQTATVQRHHAEGTRAQPLNRLAFPAQAAILLTTVQVSPGNYQTAVNWVSPRGYPRATVLVTPTWPWSKNYSIPPIHF